MQAFSSPGAFSGGAFSGRGPFGPGGKRLPAPPPGYGYIYTTDSQGRAQVVYATDASGVSRPYIASTS